MKKLISVFLFLLLTTTAYAGSKDIVAGVPVRTQRCYNMSNQWFGTYDAPVSQSGTYFWGHESQDYAYPNDGPYTECYGTPNGVAGRKYVYGTTADLAANNALSEGASKLSDYQTKIKAVPTTGCTIPENGKPAILWSPLAGEESIGYANCAGEGEVKKADFSQATPTWSTVCDWSAIGLTGSDDGTTWLDGWGNTEGILVGEYGTNTGVNCNVITNTPALNVGCGTQPCTTLQVYQASAHPNEPGTMNLYQTDGVQRAGTGHNQSPRNSNQFITDYCNSYMREPDGTEHFDGRPFETEYAGDAYYGCHANWTTDPDYFLTDISNNPGVTNNPHIMPHAGIAQYYWNRTSKTFTEIRRFLNVASAAPWQCTTGACSGTLMNWHSMILPSMNHGKTSIAYTATNGKYSYADFVAYPATTGTNWEPIGMWIATVSIGDVISPTVTIASPTSNPTYATSVEGITISGTCTDNVSCASVTWTCDNCTVTSGTATGTANWTVSLTQTSGANTFIATGHDAATNTGTDQLVSTYTPIDPPDVIGAGARGRMRR